MIGTFCTVIVAAGIVKGESDETILTRLTIYLLICVILDTVLRYGRRRKGRIGDAGHTDVPMKEPRYRCPSCGHMYADAIPEAEGRMICPWCGQYV